jgi:hypothetical protein
MKYEAYWIFPDGSILPVEGHHIDEVIKTPSKFGFTLRKIRSIYKKHNEELYLEGDARIEILRTLLKRGWIRIRYVKRPSDSFTVEVYKLNSKTKANVRKWAVAVTRKIDNVPKFTGYHLLEIKPGGNSVTGTLGDFGGCKGKINNGTH